MISALTLIGLITLFFATATYRVLGELSIFGMVQASVGISSLILAAVGAIRRANQNRQPALRGPKLRILASASGVCLVAGLIYAAALRSDVSFDWTFEGRFSLSESMQNLLSDLQDPLILTLYSVQGDPRIRATRLLLEEMSSEYPAEIDTVNLAQHPEDEDLYGIASSNSVLVQLGEEWILVEQPSEGTLYQAISELSREQKGILYVAVGAGEGNLERDDALGYSGLRAALESEGYHLRPLPLAIADELPKDADGLMVIAPRRLLPKPALAAIEDFVDTGGALIAFLEPGFQSGLEAVLAHYGISSPDTLIVDRAAGPIQGESPGLNPVASAYADHPITHGLNRNRSTFFRHSRPLQLRKAKPNDRLRAVVMTSSDAWLDPDGAKHASTRMPEPPPGARTGYQTLVAAAELERDGPPARIVAFGDSMLAANQNLRALYNLDLVLNSIHWALDRPEVIALRPRTGGRALSQFPVPLQSSLRALYGIGLLIPEVILIIGGLVWLRARNA